MENDENHLYVQNFDRIDERSLFKEAKRKLLNSGRFTEKSKDILPTEDCISFKYGDNILTLSFDLDYGTYLYSLSYDALRLAETILSQN